MFERFTDRARRVVVLAQDEARALHHDYIGTEHLLLGLIHEGEGAAFRALERLGVSFEAVRRQVEEVVGVGERSPSGHIAFTPRAKKVLELSLREALQLGHNYIGTEHILLGLIREGEGVAAQVLVKLGADLNRARQQVASLLEGAQTTPSGALRPVLPTSLVGSYAQPDWLIDRTRLAGRFPPRVRATELWRVAPEFLQEAQDDATLAAIRAQEEAGLDIITDGEIRRESYSNHFATALDGVDIDNPGTAPDRTGHPNPVPRIVGPIRRLAPIEADDVRFLRAHTQRTIKMTVPGPFTMSQQAQNDHYPDAEAAAMAYAEAVRAEIADLFAAGADIVQLDEPYLQARPDAARAYGLTALNAALADASGTTAVHLCFGYAAIVHDRPEGYSFLPELAACSADQISIETAQSGLDLGVLADLTDKTIILGVIDLSTPDVETPELVAERTRRAFDRLPPEQLVIAPDCGMKYLPRASAEGKMRAMVSAARQLRRDLASR